MKKELLLSPQSVAAAYNRRYPDGPIRRPLESAEKRASAAMNRASATDATRKKAAAEAEKRVSEMDPGSARALRKKEEAGAIMDQLLKEAAVAVFSTMHVVFALYVHEVVFFDVLVNIPTFQASVRRKKKVADAVQIESGFVSKSILRLHCYEGEGGECRTLLAEKYKACMSTGRPGGLVGILVTF